MALIKCNLCGQKVSSRAKFCPKCKCPTPPRKSAAKDISQKTPANLIDIIDSLEIAPEFKELFKLMATSGLKRKILGVPFFASDDPRLKLWNFIDAKKSIVSLLAFFLGPIFYFAKGMWRKGVTSFVLLLLMTIGFSFLPGALSAITVLCSAFFIMFISALMAKYDYYRKVILSQRFWW